MTTKINMSGRSESHPLRRPIMLLAIVLLVLLFAGAGALVVGLLLLGGHPLAAMLTGLLGVTDKTAWHFSRSAGTVAYLLLSGSMFWGLLQSSKIAKEAIPVGLSFAMHNILSWLAIVFTGIHAVVLLLDSFYTYTLPDLAIPFIGPYRPFSVGLGIFGFYIMGIVVISFRFRKQIGQKRWRALHFLSFVLFVLATVHGVASGTDTSKASMQLMYLGSGLIVFFLSTYRLLTRNATPSKSARVTI